jgi:hypothetical protein
MSNRWAPSGRYRTIAPPAEWNNHISRDPASNLETARWKAYSHAGTPIIVFLFPRQVRCCVPTPRYSSRHPSQAAAQLID